MKNNQLPKYHETFFPILQILKNGNTLHYLELYEKVIHNFYNYIPDEIKERKTSSGANILRDRIGWGKSYLKQGEFLSYPERGRVKITPKGLSVLSRKSFTLQDLKKDKDFIKHKSKKIVEKDNKNSNIEISNLTPQDLIDQGFSYIKNEVLNELIEKVKDINPYIFENLILILLEKMGYGEFQMTKKSNDGGIDGIINEDKLGLEKIYIQTKRYAAKNKVRETDIRNFIGAMSGDTQKGVFVTTSEFDSKAVEKAQNAHHKIILIDGEKLVNLMYQYKVGVQIKKIYEIKELDSDFFDLL